MPLRDVASRSHIFRRFAMPATHSPLESMVAKARSLYTLPAVAMEVIRLTDSARVDTQALKQCIERDPALSAKLLKVVNSSLFGLSGKVENLTQAIALLGIKPLKLLVLGFSLPDGLLTDLDAQQLRHYWRGALTRAVAARQLAESKWQVPGDDAFLVALLQDIGQLVLLQQLGTPYARFLDQVRTERGRLVDLERLSLGFDHRELTVALMRDWNLPQMYTAAIAPAAAQRTSGGNGALGNGPATTVTTEMLGLVDLFTELVDEHRLQVLPDLLEQGAKHCDLTKDELNKLVAEVQPQVEQLAGVLMVDLGERETYAQVLAAAHQQLAIEAEDAAGRLLMTDDQVCDQLLRDTHDLKRAVDEFTRQPDFNATGDTISERADAPAHRASGPRGRAATPAAARRRLTAAVIAAAVTCRQNRQPLSVLGIEVCCDDQQQAMEVDCGNAMMSAIERLLEDGEIGQQQLIRLTPTSLALVLPEVERGDAVRLAQQLARSLADGNYANALASFPLDVKAGAASIAVIPKGFDPERMLQAVEGCLAAARASGGTATKSIEVY